MENCNNYFRHLDKSLDNIFQVFSRHVFIYTKSGDNSVMCNLWSKMLHVLQYM